MEEAESFIYEKDGNRYLTFEISKLKEADKFNRTHTCYVTKLQENTSSEETSTNNQLVPEKTKKSRTNKS